jgi:hypothetical protein
MSFTEEKQEFTVPELFTESELIENSVVRNFRTTACDGKHTITEVNQMKNWYVGISDIPLNMALFKEFENIHKKIYQLQNPKK